MAGVLGSGPDQQNNPPATDVIQPGAPPYSSITTSDRYFKPSALISSRSRGWQKMKTLSTNPLQSTSEKSADRFYPVKGLYLASSEFLSRQMEVWAVFFLSPVDSPLTVSGLTDSTGGPMLTMRPDCAHLVAFRRAAAASSVITSQQPPWRSVWRHSWHSFQSSQHYTL